MYKEQLQLLNLNFPGAITLPLNPRIQVSGIVVESCKYMHSKKVISNNKTLPSRHWQHILALCSVSSEKKNLDILWFDSFSSLVRCRCG
jgi:hypothetical protein